MKITRRPGLRGPKSAAAIQRSREVMLERGERVGGEGRPSGAWAYAECRLRAADEARSAQLAADPRCYIADPDER